MPKEDYKGFRHGARTVICQAPSPLVDFVAAQLAKEPTPPALNALQLIDLGAVYVDEERCLNPARLLKSEDEVRIHTDPRRFALPPDLPSRILSETEDSLLVEKPAGLPTEPTVDNLKENLLSFLEDFRGQRFFLVHRLAPESEGLLLIAKDQEAASRFSRDFSEGRIKRRYVAYVESPVGIGEQGDGAIRILSCEEQRARTSLITEGLSTWLLVSEPIDLCYRLEVEFTMARPKDVREHLAKIASPIIGDRALGSRHELVDSGNRKPALAFRALALSVDALR